jgi:hypothetical protein
LWGRATYIWYGGMDRGGAEDAEFLGGRMRYGGGAFREFEQDGFRLDRQEKRSSHLRQCCNQASTRDTYVPRRARFELLITRVLSDLGCAIVAEFQYVRHRRALSGWVVRRPAQGNGSGPFAGLIQFGVSIVSRRRCLFIRSRRRRMERSFGQRSVKSRRATDGSEGGQDACSVIWFPAPNLRRPCRSI